MRTVSVIYPLLAGLIFGASNVFADTVTAKLTFNKRPPMTGIIYIPQDNATSQNAEIDQKNKEFTQALVAGTPNAKAIFKNSDTDDHNIFVSDIDAGVNFDVGLIPAGSKSEVNIDWKPDTLVRMGCKIHPKMKAYLANVNSNSFQVMEFEKGTLEYAFTISDVNAGEEKIVVSLPKYDLIEVSLPAGKSTTVELIRKGKPKGSITITRS